MKGYIERETERDTHTQAVRQRKCVREKAT